LWLDATLLSYYIFTIELEKHCTIASFRLFAKHLVSPIATGGAFVGLALPNKNPILPKFKYETLQISKVFINF